MCDRFGFLYRFESASLLERLVRWLRSREIPDRGEREKSCQKNKTLYEIAVRWCQWTKRGELRNFHIIISFHFAPAAWLELCGCSCRSRVKSHSLYVHLFSSHTSSCGPFYRLCYSLYARALVCARALLHRPISSLCSTARRCSTYVKTMFVQLCNIFPTLKVRVLHKRAWQEQSENSM